MGHRSTRDLGRAHRRLARRPSTRGQQQKPRRHRHRGSGVSISRRCVTPPRMSVKNSYHDAHGTAPEPDPALPSPPPGDNGYQRRTGHRQRATLSRPGTPLTNRVVLARQPSTRRVQDRGSCCPREKCRAAAREACLRGDRGEPGACAKEVRRSSIWWPGTCHDQRMREIQWLRNAGGRFVNRSAQWLRGLGGSER